jgi:acid stress-induced BolA-like protein IbaG/YrbA
LSFLAITTLFRSASQVERQVIVLAGLGNNCSLNSSSKEIHFCSVFHVSSSNRCWSTLVFIQYT